MRYRRLDLNLLIALDAILAERSVTRAASRLNVTQPAMSGALARLREYFEDPIVMQVGRQMELTSLAQSLVGPSCFRALGRAVRSSSAGSRNAMATYVTSRSPRRVSPSCRTW